MKIAAEDVLNMDMAEKPISVREYEEERDKEAVEELERHCEVGQLGKPSLVTDLMGDPICRLRHFTTRVMLVVEYGEGKEIVGMIRGCVKTVNRGNSGGYVKLAYVLGLRVSPIHRRLGIGTKLIRGLEDWCKRNGAEYAYMATDCTNEPSINLFTKKCDYLKFNTPTMLVQPVHAHYKPISSSVAIIRVSVKLTESIYKRVFADSEFFPEDIKDILSSKLNLGTFMAVPKNSLSKWDPRNGDPPSFAIMSVWDTKEVFKLEVKGVSALKYAACAGSRMLDTWLPWLRLPSFPDVFRKFGVYSLYGIHMEGSGAARLMRSLCAFAHNMARDDVGCGAVVAEVGPADPVALAIPHWRRLSWTDMWCIKNLTAEEGGEGGGRSCPSDWITSSRASSSPVIFVDPRDF